MGVRAWTGDCTSGPAVATALLIACFGRPLSFSKSAKAATGESTMTPPRSNNTALMPPSSSSVPLSSLLSRSTCVAEKAPWRPAPCANLEAPWAAWVREVRPCVNSLARACRGEKPNWGRRGMAQRCQQGVRQGGAEWAGYCNVHSPAPGQRRGLGACTSGACGGSSNAPNATRDARPASKQARSHQPRTYMTAMLAASSSAALRA